MHGIELVWQQVIPALHKQQCLQTTVFMQDGATPHIGYKVKELLCAKFGKNHVISWAFPDAWHPHSPDFKSLWFLVVGIPERPSLWRRNWLYLRWKPALHTMLLKSLENFFALPLKTQNGLSTQNWCQWSTCWAHPVIE